MNIPPHIELPFETAVFLQGVRDAGLGVAWEDDLDPSENGAARWVLQILPPKGRRRFTPAQRALLDGGPAWRVPAGSYADGEVALIDADSENDLAGLAIWAWVEDLRNAMLDPATTPAEARFHRRAEDALWRVLSQRNGRALLKELLVLHWKAQRARTEENAP